MMAKSRFQIVFTYRCNLSCKWCDRFVDTLPEIKSDITSEEIILGAELLKSSNIKNTRTEICGGEPLVHPQFEALGKLVNKIWGDGGKIPTAIYTNTQITGPLGIGKYHRSGLPKKHNPTMLSPYDLGIEPSFGFENRCRVQNLCGALFDSFGFAACSYAGVIGRILGIDFYKTSPVILGQYELCKHCIHSLSSKVRGKLQKKAVAGKLEFPTKTFRAGLDQNAESPVSFPRIGDRLN